MKLKEIITPNPQVIAPDATLYEAAQKMKSFNIGMLPVCDGDRIVGTITDRDIAIRAVAEARDPRMTTVRDCMTHRVVCCYEDQKLNDIAELMEDRQIRRLPVLDHEKHLIGIISLGDLAVRSGKEKLAGEVLERVSEPPRPMG